MDKKGNMTSQKAYNISSILECDGEVIDEMPENDFNRIDIRNQYMTWMKNFAGRYTKQK